MHLISFRIKKINLYQKSIIRSSEYRACLLYFTQNLSQVFPVHYKPFNVIVVVLKNNELLAQGIKRPHTIDWKILSDFVCPDRLSTCIKSIGKVIQKSLQIFQGSGCVSFCEILEHGLNCQRKFICRLKTNSSSFKVKINLT